MAEQSIGGAFTDAALSCHTRNVSKSVLFDETKIVTGLLPHVKMRAKADSLPQVNVRAWELGLW
jgi:hypothetical protein